VNNDKVIFIFYYSSVNTDKNKIVKLISSVNIDSIKSEKSTSPPKKDKAIYKKVINK